MSELTLKDILNAARRESQLMRHHYIGVEHLLIAMLENKGGLSAGVIHEVGLQPQYVIDAVRRKLGKGGKQRAFPGMPQTPRVSHILEEARKSAHNNGQSEPNEKDLLVAILKDKDGLIARLFVALGIRDLDGLVYFAQTHMIRPRSTRPFVSVEYGKNFDRSKMPDDKQLQIIRHLFDNYNFIRIERYLTGGYSGAVVLIVTPITMDRREEAPVVVKISQADSIMDEAQRYDTYVKTRLPPLTARLEDKPISPETSDLAGIKYTLVTDNDHIPKDLRSKFAEWKPTEFNNWLENALFSTFGRIWWLQNRPYRFQVWQEYDWMLPPLLTLELVKDDPPPTSSITLRIPMRRAKLKGIEYGDVVAVENFLIQKIDSTKRIIRLAAGHGTETARAYEIEIRGINLDDTTFYRGEVIESITGTVWKTREELLSQAVRTLEPDFEPDADIIPLWGLSPERVPNPIFAYETLLDNYINGTVSTIHGDLHPGNILIGPGESAFLIDYAHTRDGHVLFDWAMLETAILTDLIIPQICNGWDDIRQAASAYIKLNETTISGQLEQFKGDPFSQLISIRKVVNQLLATGHWAEYFTPIVFCALRALTWETLPVDSRRFMLLIAGYNLYELSGRLSSISEHETPTPDETNSMPLDDR